MTKLLAPAGVILTPKPGNSSFQNAARLSDMATLSTNVFVNFGVAPPGLPSRKTMTVRTLLGPHCRGNGQHDRDHNALIFWAILKGGKTKGKTGTSPISNWGTGGTEFESRRSDQLPRPDASGKVASIRVHHTLVRSSTLGASASTTCHPSRPHIARRRAMSWWRKTTSPDLTSLAAYAASSLGS